jgi:hypothetical protein
MCKFIAFLYGLIPLQGFRAFLIKRHIANCSICEKEPAIETLLQEKLRIPEWIESEQSLWPKIKEKVLSPEPLPSAHRQKVLRFMAPRWQWALAGLALLLVVGINILIERDLDPQRLQEEFIATATIPTVIITHAEIKGKKAKPFIYQTHEKCFIWFEESKSEGD